MQLELSTFSLKNSGTVQIFKRLDQVSRIRIRSSEKLRIWTDLDSQHRRKQTKIYSLFHTSVQNPSEKDLSFISVGSGNFFNFRIRRKLKMTYLGSCSFGLSGVSQWLCATRDPVKQSRVPIITWPLIRTKLIRFFFNFCKIYNSICQQELHLL